MTEFKSTNTKELIRRLFRAHCDDLKEKNEYLTFNLMMARYTLEDIADFVTDAERDDGEVRNILRELLTIQGFIKPDDINEKQSSS